MEKKKETKIKNNGVFLSWFFLVSSEDRHIDIYPLTYIPRSWKALISLLLGFL